LGADIKLLGLIAAMLLFVMSILLLLTLRQAGRVRGGEQWIWGTMGIAAGVVLNTMQESIPQFLGLVVSNSLMIAGSTLTALGSYEYRYEQKLPLRWGYVGLAAITMVFAFYVYVQPSTPARVLLFSFLIGVSLAWDAWVLLAGSRLRPNAVAVKHSRFTLAHSIMVAGLVMATLVFAARFVDTLHSFYVVAAPAGSSRTVFLFYAVTTASRVLLMLGMVLVIVDELNQNLHTLALRDPLTGLLNRRGLNLAIGEKPLTQCSLLMLDLDYFKAINDDFGHDVGDQVLALFSRCAAAHMPAGAALARLGGEEFCAFLPATHAFTAEALAEKFRAAFSNESEALGHGRKHTVSIGIACAALSAVPLNLLMKSADQALYEAKKQGRNRVFFAAGVQPLN
jgi:diguanylate cyclase (GGDEF)-like protein